MVQWHIMVEYGKVKSIKVILCQNGGTENRAMICYETEMETSKKHQKEEDNSKELLRNII